MTCASHIAEPSIEAYLTSASIAQGYDDYFAKSDLFAYDAALLRGWFERPGRLIDLGCGSGRHVVLFARASFDVVGVDLSEHMLRVATAKLEREKRSARLLPADIVSLDAGFEAGSFDYALCMFSTFGMIDGSANRRRALRTWHRLLEPGGLLALHVHNRWHSLFRAEGQAHLISNLFWRMTGRSEWGDKYISNYRGIRRMYIHVFSRREIMRLLEQAGFEIVELVHLNARRDGKMRPGWWASLRANGFVILARAVRRPCRSTA